MHALLSILVLGQDDLELDLEFDVEPVVEPAVELSTPAWMLESLGLFYGITIPLAGIVVLIGACFVVTMSRRPAVIAAYLAFVPIPFLIGVFSCLHNFVSASWAVASYTGPPTPWEFYWAISYFLSAPLVGLAATFPAYVVTAAGLFLWTIRARGPSPQKSPG